MHKHDCQFWKTNFLPRQRWIVNVKVTSFLPLERRGNGKYCMIDTIHWGVLRSCAVLMADEIQLIFSLQFHLFIYRRPFVLVYSGQLLCWMFQGKEIVCLSVQQSQHCKISELLRDSFEFVHIKEASLKVIRDRHCSLGSASPLF